MSGDAVLNPSPTEETRSEVLNPREAARFIAERSKDVTVSSAGVKNAASKIYGLYKTSDVCLDVNRWRLNELNPTTNDEATLSWIFVVDLLNFSFWSDDENRRYSVTYRGKVWTGYWSLCAAINRAIDEGVPITDPRWYGTATLAQLEKVFRSDNDTPMPLLAERRDSLHLAAAVLLEKYEGRFARVVADCGGSAVALYRRVVDDFVTFRDEAEFEGRRVGIYKRAQILAGDIWACFGGKSFGAFSDIDEITAFADYRVPQALVWLGALEYSNSLMGLLKSNTMLSSGQREEVEIRGCTLWAIELIVAELNALLQTNHTLTSDPSSVTPADLTHSADPATPLVVNCIAVDHFLWDYRREHDAEMNDIPYHKIRCIYY